MLTTCGFSDIEVEIQVVHAKEASWGWPISEAETCQSINQ
jgi:hypothetical protein